LVVLLRLQISKEVYDNEERFRIIGLGSLKKIRSGSHFNGGSIYLKIGERYPEI
jgi:hypothetical protein